MRLHGPVELGGTVQAVHKLSEAHGVGRARPLAWGQCRLHWQAALEEELQAASGRTTQGTQGNGLHRGVPHKPGG